METKTVRGKVLHKNSEVEFQKVVIPSKMRSVYWTYFGFPADGLGNIVADDTIICTLCHKAISYNKNTTNLRTHLTAKHNHVIPQLNAENEMKPKNAKKKFIPKNVEIEKKRTRRRVEIEINTSRDIQPEIEMATEKIENEIYQYQEYNTIEESSFDVVEENDMTVQNSSKALANLSPHIEEMIIADLLPLETIEGSGFLNFVYAMDPAANLPRSKELEHNIGCLYEKKFKTLLASLRSHTTKFPFSLCFEIWSNVETRNFVSIYINTINKNFGSNFNHILLNTVELYKYTDFNEVLTDINLKNCSAAVINTHDSIVENFLVKNDIPIVFCFDSVIQTCLKNVFSMSSVSRIFSDISDILEKHSDVLPEMGNLPQLNCAFPWTKYNLLKFFHDNVLATEEPNDLLLKARELVQCLEPLKIAVETLVEESNALSSLMKPLTKRLLEQHFCSTSSDSLLMVDIKDAINRELSKSIMSNNFLTVSSFVDPRFHKFLEPVEIQRCKEVLEKKSINVLNACKTESSSWKSTNRLPEFSKRSSLKMFFEPTDTEENVIVGNININLEIKRYRNEAVADLDQDPLIWWNKPGYSFGGLKKIADIYNCVPSCVNNVYKRAIEDQINFINRRYVLRGKIINHILFMHYNKKC